MKRKYLIIIILIFSQFLIDFNNYAQCTNGTIMCTSLDTANDSLCTAGNIDINILGGTLGPGSKWELYAGSCGGTLITTTTSNTFININVTSNTTFYCKADSCDISSCISLDVYIVSPSSDPTSLSISNDTLCSAGNVDFTVSGGSLGANAQWELFENSCGGSPIATSANGTFSTIAVSSSATYYVNANGYCNTTNCSSINFVLANNSSDPTSLLASNDTLCSSGNVDFTVSGGSLGTNAQWELFENSCGGSPIATSANGTFSTIPVSSSTTYYVNATGYCNTTNCSNANITFADSSLIAANILTTDTIICENGNITLSIDGGSLGTLADWIWYDDTCGGNIIGHGTSINLIQTSTKTYSVRAEGFCNTTNCRNITIRTRPNYIELDSLSMASVINPIDSTWYIPDSVCPQSPVKLFAHFTGPFPDFYSITWYKNSCGSAEIGVGDSIIVYPDSNTTYYARVVGQCGASVCKSIIIKTKDGSLAPTGVIASHNNFCTGGSTTLTVEGGLLGTDAQWSWYKGNCSGTAIGNGSSITVTPASTTTYFVRATGSSCGNTACASILINTYDLNMYHSPIDPTCESSPIILEGGFPTGGTYSGLGITDSLFDPDIAGIGTHIITYTFIDDNNCTDSIQTNIDVLQHNPDPLLITASSYEICNGNSTKLSIDTNSVLINGSKWVWYKDACETGTIIDSTENQDTLWVNQTNNIYNSVNYIQVSPSTTANYYVRSEGGECPPSNCIGLTIDVYTLETHLDDLDDICGTATPSFQLSGGDPSGGNYSGNGVTNNIFNPVEAGIGNHPITYTYTNGLCVATDIVTISISSSPINIYSSIEQETCSEGGVMIHAHTLNGAGFYNYLWSDGSLENPLTYAKPGQYSVLINDGNDCYSFLDSIVVDSSFICIEIINSFTPNNDGINDYWTLDFSDYESVDLIIFNKWGNKITQFTDLIINWDGSNLPSGTYYYIIQLTESSGDIINQSGPITILR